MLVNRIHGILGLEVIIFKRRSFGSIRDKHVIQAIYKQTSGMIVRFNIYCVNLVLIADSVMRRSNAGGGVVGCLTLARLNFLIIVFDLAAQCIAEVMF